MSDSAERRRAFEREFIVRLGAYWLGSRLQVFGGLTSWPYDLCGALLGMLDYSQEMTLVCEEVRAARRGKGDR